MKSRIINLILASLILFASMPAMAANATYLVCERFDEYALNQIPENIMLDAIDGRVAQRDGLDKAIVGKAWGASDFLLTKEFQTSSAKMVFSADIKIDSTNTEAYVFSVKTTAGATVNLLKFSENGRVTLPDGKIIGGYSLGQWKNYTLAVNFENGLIDVYIDGKKLLDNHLFTYTKNTAPASVSFMASAPDAPDFTVMNIDNIKIYEGLSLLPDSAFPSKGVSSEVLEFTETTSMPESGILYAYKNFDSYDDVTFTPNGNKVEVINVEGNNVLHISDTNPQTQAMASFVVSQTAYDLDKYIIEFDIYPIKTDGGVSMLEITDHSGDLHGAIAIANGTSFYLNGVYAGNLSTNKWHHIAIAFDNVQVTYTAYVNGQERVTRPIHRGVAKPLTIRTRSAEGTGDVEYYMDNISLYSGSKLKEFTDEEIKSVAGGIPLAESEEKAKNLIGDAKIFMVDNDTLFIDGDKKYYKDFSDIVPYKDENEVFMVPDFLISKAFGCEIMKVGENISVNGRNALTVGSKSINGMEKTLDSAPTEKDGTLFLPLESFCKNVLSLYTYLDDRNYYIIDTKPIALSNSNLTFKTDEPIDTIYRYMQFDRPSGEQIYNDLLKHSPNKAHPRLITTKAELEKVKNYVNTDRRCRKSFEAAIKLANTQVERPPVNQVFTAGSFLGSARSVYQRTRILGIAYQMTGDDVYAKRCWEEMENVLSWPHWNGNTYSMLDTSETMYGIALGYDFIYDYLTDEQKAYTRKVLYEKGLRHYINSYYGQAVRVDWVTATGNWGCVCNGAAIATAISIMDDADEKLLEACKTVLTNAVQSLEWPLMLTYPDGAWSEGPAYTDYTMIYLFGGALAPLKFACGTTYDLLDAKGVSDILTACMGLQGPMGTSFNFGDSQEISLKGSWGYLIALLYDNDSLMAAWDAVRTNVAAPEDGCSLLWYRPTENLEELDLPLDKYFYSCDAGTMKSSHTIKDGAYVGIKAGLNGTNHDNLDLGTFIFDTQGVRWACELGLDDYNMKSINYWTQHYYVYKCRPEGQNVIIINQKPDDASIDYWGGQQNHTVASLIKEVSKPRGAIMVLDLKDPYKLDVNSYERGFYFGDDRQTVIIQDEISLKEDNSDITWFMHTPTNPTVSEDGKSMILEKHGKKLKVEVDTNASDWHFEVQEEKPLPLSPQLPDQLKGEYSAPGKRLALCLKASGKLYITVKLSPILPYETFDAPKYVPISEWEIPDGEIPEKVRAKTILADGVEIENFDPDRVEYTIDVPYGSPVPKITATATIGKCEVIQSNDFATPSKVVITANDGRTITYTIYTNVTARMIDDLIPGLMPQPGIPEGYKVVTPQTSAVSAVPEASNNEKNIIDNDFSTRWAVQGYDEWAEVDLGKVYDISGIALGVYEGNKRQNIFKFAVSEDGINYYIIFDGRSSGKTTEYDSFMFDTRKVRFIRYLGATCTANDWNSVTELAAIVKE